MPAHAVPRLPRDRLSFFFDRLASPILTIRSGQRVVVETEDANVAFIRQETDVYTDFNVLFERAGGANPVTGPLYVEAAHPGDVLVVKFNRITVGGPESLGYSAVFPNLGSLESPYTLQPALEAKTKILPISEGSAAFRGGHKTIRIPLQPFVGTIGVAPKAARTQTMYHGHDYVGNIDCLELAAGNSVVLPVNVEGALLSIGDCHGAQGAGEITGVALETRGEVDLTVEVVAKSESKYVKLPQVNSPEWIGSIGCIWGASLADNIRAAYVDLVNRMERFYGFDRTDAYILLGLVGRVSVGQVLDPFYSCVAMIDREYVE